MCPVIMTGCTRNEIGCKRGCSSPLVSLLLKQLLVRIGTNYVHDFAMTSTKKIHCLIGLYVSIFGLN